jgi:DNA-binding NtrC family response regulator
MNATKQNPKLLLVDDDHSVRRLCRLILERAGFGVIEADSALAAQTVWEANAHAIDMLVTDFEMPGMTGLQLSAVLRTARPELKILLISGNIRESVPSSIAFLAKPFRPSDLTDAVHLCLAS